MLGYLQAVATNEATTNKMADQTQSQQVMMKDPKKVRAGKYWMSAIMKLAKAQKSEPNLSQYYGAEAVVAIGVSGIIGYCVHQSKKVDV